MALIIKANVPDSDKKEKKKEQVWNRITALLQLSGADQENIIQMEHFIQRPKNPGRDKI